MENATPIPHSDGKPLPGSDDQSRGHETSDVDLRPIIWFAVIMFSAAIVIHIGVWGLMHLFQRDNDQANPTPSPFVDTRAQPTVTPLQPSIGHPTQPFEDMESLQARWQRELTTYGPVAGRSDVIRIPLERAIQIRVNQGIGGPSTKPTTQVGEKP